MTPAAIFQTLAKLVLPLAVLALLYVADKRADQRGFDRSRPRPGNPRLTAWHLPPEAGAVNWPPRSPDP